MTEREPLPQDSPPGERGTLTAEHKHPNPLLRRLTEWLLALGIGGALFGVGGLVVLGIGYGLPLLPLMAIFLAILIAPLLLLTVLHPHITVYERGLWLKPLLWRGTWVAWPNIIGVEEHTLIRRGTTKDRQHEHFGRLVVVDGLPWQYAIVGLMAGLGNTRAFGISTHSHTDYPKLVNVIERHKRRG